MAEDRLRRLRWALALNLVIVVGQVSFGVVAHSLGLLADAGHNLTDAAAIGVSLIAVRMTLRPPTAARSFGYHRSTVLAAQANAAAVLAITAVIAYEGVRRLAHPSPVRGGIVLAVALVAVIANVAGALLLREHGHAPTDLGMRSVMLHLAADALASLGVAVAGGVILVTGGFRWLDPVASLAIGALIMYEAVRLLLAATDVLLESTPAGLDMAEVAHVMGAVPGVEEVHDLHAWSLSSDVRALSAHIVMAGHPTLEEAQAVAEQVKHAVELPFAIAHATLELECESCVEGGGDPCAMDAPGPRLDAHDHAHP